MSEKRGPGRPPRAVGVGTRLEIRLTEPELIRWQWIADQRGATLAELVRDGVEFGAARKCKSVGHEAYEGSLGKHCLRCGAHLA